MTSYNSKKAARTALSGIAGYSTRGNFGGLLVHSMFLMYLPDGTNVYGSRGEEFDGMGSV